MKEIQINIKELNRLYQSDMSLGTIADQLGISLSTLRNKLNVHPASIRRKIKQLNLIRCDKWQECKLNNFNQLLQMRTNGMTFNKLPIILGFNRQLFYTN